MTKKSVTVPLAQANNDIRSSVSVKAGGQLAGIGSTLIAGKKGKIGADVSVYPVDLNISSQGAKITGNAFKTSLVAQAGSGKLEGEFKAGEYTISGNGLNMSETISTSASYSVNSSENSSSYNTDNNWGMSAKLGPITVGIESNINKVSSAISNSVQALAAFIIEVFTDITNNDFLTDPQKRSQETYIEEERIKQ